MNNPYTERSGRFASLTWYGQSGFRLAAGESRVLVDPFLTDRSDRRYRPPAAAADFADITLVLCTHEHEDHLDLPFLREFCAVNSTATIVVPAPVVELAVGSGVDRSRLVGAVPGEEQRDRDVTVHPVPALHGMGGDEPVVYEFSPGGGPVRFLGYVMDVGGIRFYHSGDCLVYPELPATLSALAPDVLMIPINGRDHMRESRGIVGNMNETEAAWLCAEVSPAFAIPMHYDAIASNTGDPGHFTTLVRESAAPTTVLAPPRAQTRHPGPPLTVPRERRPDGRALDVAIFQPDQAGNVICGQRPEPVPRQIRPPEVASQDVGSASLASLKEPHHPARQVPFVEGVGRQYHVNAGGCRGILVQDVGTDGPDRNAVGAGVHGDSRDSERIDVIAGHRRGSGPGGRNGHQPGAGGDIDHMPVFDRLGVVEKVAGQRLATRPGERPEGRVQTGPPGR